ncbi:MAG: glycosyltransferase [Planctomycetes bacterium]|nr:glycosyltransferase [Planctomycetota bacterium]
MNNKSEYGIFDPAEIPCEEISDSNVLVKEPVVSTFMVTYNHAPYIAQAIQGVLQQETKFPFELVIGEDCSTDGTREIVFDYQKSYPEIIRVVTSDKNIGARRNGIRTEKACRGKYIAYCEGDDYWHHPQKLQKQVDYLESHPECGLVHSDQDRYYERTGKKIRDFFRTTNNIPLENFNIFRGWGHYHILTCTVIVRKHLIDKIISDPHIYRNDQYIGGSDIPLAIEVSMLSKIHYIDESLSTYTVRNESASNISNPLKRARFNKSVIEAYLYLAGKYDQEKEKEFLQQRWCRASLWLAFFESNAKLAYKVRRIDNSFSVKAWILYVGAINPIIHIILRTPCMLYLKLKKIHSSRQLRRFADF